MDAKCTEMISSIIPVSWWKISVLNYEWGAVWSPLLQSSVMINGAYVSMKSSTPLQGLGHHAQFIFHVTLSPSFIILSNSSWSNRCGILSIISWTCLSLFWLVGGRWKKKMAQLFLKYSHSCQLLLYSPLCCTPPYFSIHDVHQSISSRTLSFFLPSHFTPFLTPGTSANTFTLMGHF